MDMTSMVEHARAQPPPLEGLDDGMMFGTCIANECLADGGEANVPMNDNVGSVVGNTTEPPRIENEVGLSPLPVGLDDSEDLYSDSSHADIGPLTQPTIDGI